MWTAVFDVINHRPFDGIRHRQDQWLMCLMLDDGQLFFLPVKAAETEVLDISDPQPKHACEEDHGLIPLPGRIVPVNGCKHGLKFICLPC